MLGFWEMISSSVELCAKQFSTKIVSYYLTVLRCTHTHTRKAFYYYQSAPVATQRLIKSLFINHLRGESEPQNGPHPVLLNSFFYRREVFFFYLLYDLNVHFKNPSQRSTFWKAFVKSCKTVEHFPSLAVTATNGYPQISL